MAASPHVNARGSASRLRIRLIGAEHARNGDWLLFGDEVRRIHARYGDGTLLVEIPSMRPPGWAGLPAVTTYRISDLLRMGVTRAWTPRPREARRHAVRRR